MGQIVLLDDLTINKISAGEVIERPANVVKELVENSLDAGAKNILIEIKKGGKELIKIVDDGKGIEENDIPFSLERHATSKIKKIEDLENTYTMGFRGEALASIASISEFTIISKTENEDVGVKVFAKAGEIMSAEEVAIKTGTTMIVQSLFFNVPVRYKFLKQDSTEFKYIKEWVEKAMLANPDVSFNLINEGKSVLRSNGNGHLKDLIYLLYSKDVKDNIIEVNYEENKIKITGVIGNTLIARDTRKDQIFFLNKRNVKNAVLTNSADQAFKSGGTGIGKFGFYILNLEMPAYYYDINVHPTKMEVRFREEEAIFRVVYNAIKTAMLNKEFLGNVEVEDNKEEYIKKEYNFLTNNFINKNKFYRNTDLLNASNSLELEKNIEFAENSQNTKILDDNKISENSGDLIKRENARNVDYKFIGILFRTYITVEIDGEIYLIDQHAGHERLLYEQIKDNYKNNLKNNTQMTLIPEIVNLTHKEFEFVKENMSLFSKVDFDIEEFGENAIKINGVPDIEYRDKVDSKTVFMDTLDEMLTNSRSNTKDIEERFIATVACKSAVKANMDLTKEEVDNLIQNLLILKNPYTCPHGRPTTIKFNKDEMSFF